MNVGYSDAVEIARSYYNSDDADNFYHRVWGGEDIHIGLYEHDDEPISHASRRTVAHLADLLDELAPAERVLDMGAGYGGAARYLAQNFGCRVVALNLSEVENARNREKNRAEQLHRLIDVVDGSFESVPFENESFTVVWSQDAFLHSGDRRRVIAEAARVLEPGGRLIFTDPMQADDCPAGLLRPVLDRLHLSSLGSPAFYRTACEENGLEETAFEDHTPQLARHYARVKAELAARDEELAPYVSDGYRQRMREGLQHWVDAGNAGHLCWGVFRFRKPA